MQEVFLQNPQTVPLIKRVFSDFSIALIVLQPNHLRSVWAVHACLPTVGYLLAAKSWFFIFLSEKKLEGQYTLTESTSIC